MRVSDLDLAVATLDEVVDQAPADRSRTVQRVERDQVLETLGLETAQDVLHTVGLELEDARRAGTTEQLVDRRIVELESIEVGAVPRLAADRQQRVVDQASAS